VTDLDPRVARALDVLSPDDRAAPEWSGLAPAPKRRRRLAFALLLVSVIALAVLLATPAFGLRERISLLLDGVPDNPVVEEMSVFDVPRTEADVLPPHIAASVGGRGECTDWEIDSFGGCLGRGLGDQSRLLLSDLGVAKTELWAWPTETGGVCWAWDAGAGGCHLDWAFQAERWGRYVGFMSIDPDEHRVGAPTVLVGIVPDRVARVDLVVAGVSVPAVVDRNGVFYELPSTRCVPADVEEVRVTFDDGTVETGPTGWGSSTRREPGACWA
jgi:hypothetical protein